MMTNGSDQAQDLDLAPTPARRIRMPLDAVGALGIGELLEVARLTGHPYDRLGDALRESGGTAALVAVAIAYVLTRRLEPDVTWADAQSWRIEIVPADPTLPRRTPRTS